MPRSSLARYLNPWKHRREEHERKVAELRQRDGDNCTRCRRPVRFDFPAGHDLSAKIEPMGASAVADTIEDKLRIMGRQDPARAHHSHEIHEHLNNPLIFVRRSFTNFMHFAGREVESNARTEAYYLLVREGRAADRFFLGVKTLEQPHRLEKLERVCRFLK